MTQRMTLKQHFQEMRYRASATLTGGLKAGNHLPLTAGECVHSLKVFNTPPTPSPHWGCSFKYHSQLGGYPVVQCSVY